MTTQNSSGTLSAGVAALLASTMPDIKLLIIANTGVNPMVFKFGSAPTSATDGIPLDGASAPGGQGGALALAVQDEPGDFTPPADAVYAFSALGTSYVVQQVDGAHAIAPRLWCDMGWREHSAMIRMVTIKSGDHPSGRRLKKP
jgi:hypothetical protein